MPNSPTASKLRFEHRPAGEPALAPGTTTPRLSWRISDGPQTRARLELTRNLPGQQPTTETVELDGDAQVLVAWPFAPATSRERLQVRVQIHGDSWGDWSEPAVAEVGLLVPADWIAHMVQPEPDAPGPLPRPATWLRGEVELPAEPVSARLYVTAHGLYRAEVNGERVGDEELAPGWTSYNHRLRYQAHDVTEMLHAGRNVVGSWLVDGWWRGWYGFDGGRHNIYGRRSGVMVQLEVVLADGSTHSFGSDESWRSHTSCITASGLYEGEVHDARLDEPEWSTTACDAADWNGVSLGEVALETLVAPDGPPVRELEELPVVEVITTPAGATVLDFGQNLAGRVRFTANLAEGQRVELRHAEVMEDGELGVRPLRRAAATDVFIGSGAGDEEFEPLFTIHGFRYVQVDGWQGELDPADFTAVSIGSDLTRTGWWTSSHDQLNRLHENVRWSMRDNFVDIPTDCPQRDERLGWTGDISVFAPTANFLADTAGFMTSWLADLAVDQARVGTVPIYVPYFELLFPPMPFALWGDAAVTVPFDHYQAYGDTELPERQFASMTAWLDQVTEHAGESRLWDGDVQLGDWLDPNAPPDNPAKAMTDPGLVATAFWYRSLRMVCELARVLGRTDDERRYASLADEVRAAFRREYVTASGRLMSDSQTGYALALTHGLLEGDEVEHAGDRLAQLITENNFLIGTGFAGTPVLTDALAMTGHLDEAYHLLLGEECPSWLYAVKMGATTTWERWDSMLPDGSINPGGMTSFNHYALGAVADFMERVIGGLALASPGGRRLRIEPRPGGGLSHCTTRRTTPYGDVEVAWRREGAKLQVEVTVPGGCTAEVLLPGWSEPQGVGEGQHSFRANHRGVDDDPERPVTPDPLGSAFGRGHQTYLKAVEADGGPAYPDGIADGPNF